MSVPRAPVDIDRLLRHAARQEVDRLEQHHEPVEPRALAERVVYAHHHLTAVRAHCAELILSVADYVRQLRATREERE
jgi:hypothetical protein